MMPTERCSLPYAYLGDMTECLLPLNHDGDCATANRVADLEARTQAAITLERWVF